MRIKYICPYCKTARIVRESKDLILSHPHVIVLLICRKCKKRGGNVFLYLDGIDFLLPIEENKCGRCFKRKRDLFIIAEQNGHVSYAGIVCKNCLEIVIKDYNFVDKKIKIYNESIKTKKGGVKKRC